MAVGEMIGNVFGGANYGAGIVTFIKWFVWPVVIGLGMYGLWWLFSHNVSVRIYTPGKPSEKDKGRRTRSKENKQIKGFALLRNKKDYTGAPIPEKYFGVTKKGFGRVGLELHMIRDDQGNLQPIRPPSDEDVTEWEGMDSTDVAWGMEEARSAIQAYATKDDKWAKLAVIAPYLGLAFVVVLMIVLMQQMEGVVQGIEQVASALNNINVAEQVIS